MGNTRSVQFPESMTGVQVATMVQAELSERGIAVTMKSVSNAQLFLPRTETLAMGDFDMAYVPWTMGADPDDSAVLKCGAPSNYAYQRGLHGFSPNAFAPTWNAGAWSW